MLRKFVGIILLGLLIAFLSIGIFYYFYLKIYETTIISGKYELLEIGMTKEATLDALNRMGIKSVYPTVNRYTKIVVGKGDISKLSNAEGIQVIDHTGFVIYVKFRDDLVSDLSFTVHVPEAVKHKYSIGQTRKSVFQELEFLGASRNLEAFNYIPGDRIAIISNMSDADRVFILRYDSWQFQGLRDYPSNTSLHFEDGKLKRIVELYSYSSE